MSVVDSNANPQTIEHLKKVLASSYTLYVKTHNYHWNVEGPHFHALHGMFEEQYTELAEAVDTIAERIRALGDYAPGSFEEFSKLTEISEAKAANTNAMEMVKDLKESHEKMSALAQSTLEVADEAGDEVTIDLMVERKTVHDETAWMLRSTLA